MENNGDRTVEFMENMGDCYLFQHVTGYTRIREGCEPITIDLILTNEEDMICDMIHESPLGRSDHCVLKFYFRLYYQKSEINVEKWNFNKVDYQQIATALKPRLARTIQRHGCKDNFKWVCITIHTAKSKFIPKIKPNANKKAENTQSSTSGPKKKHWKD